MFFFPAAEVYRAKEGRHHNELGEGNAGSEGHFDGGIERGGLVVEVFEDRLEAFGGDGFDAYEGALDVGLAHGVEVLAVFVRARGGGRCG